MARKELTMQTSSTMGHHQYLTTILAEELYNQTLKPPIAGGQRRLSAFSQYLPKTATKSTVGISFRYGGNQSSSKFLLPFHLVDYAFKISYYFFS